MTRRESRENAFIIAFEKLFRDDEIEEIISAAGEAGDFETDEFCERAAVGVFEHIEELDKLISEKSSGWKIDRLSSVALTAARLALYEILYESEIPESVSINEAVELCKKYGTEGDAPYVNGMLGTIVRELGRG